MKNISSITVMTFAAALSCVALPCEGQRRDEALEAMDKIAQETAANVKKVNVVAAKQNADEFAKLFSDPDPGIRKAAYTTLIYLSTDYVFNGGKAWLDANVLMKFIEATETDPDPRAHKQAIDAMPVLNGLATFSPSPLVEKTIEQLVTLGKSKDVTVRRRAIVVLGDLETRDTSVIKLYAVAVKDTDDKVRLAAIDAVAALIDNLQGSEEKTLNRLAPILLTAYENGDEVVQERASLAIYYTKTPNNLAKLVDSKKPEDRILGNLFRFETDLQEHNAIETTQTKDQAKAFAARVRSLVPALGHPWYWVRIVALNKACTGYLNIEVPDYNKLLLEMIDNPNPDAARDAVLRLNDLLAGLPNLSWKGARMYFIDPTLPVPPKLEGQLAVDAGLCGDAQATQRLDGITRLEKQGSKAAPTLFVLIKLFADPDERVKTASRHAAKTITQAHMKELGT